MRVGGGMAFRNPPSLMKPLEITSRDASHETEAVVDHMFRHPNMAPLHRAREYEYTNTNASTNPDTNASTGALVLNSY